MISGGNTGIGFETAQELVLRGADVVIGCRNAEKMKSAIEQIELAHSKVESKEGSISGQIMDLQAMIKIYYLEIKSRLYFLINPHTPVP